MIKILKNKFILSIFQGIITIAIPVILNIVVKDQQGFIKRFSQLLGGDILNGGYIQLLIYITLFIGLNYLLERYRHVSSQEKAFTFNILQTKDQFVYYEKDIQEIKSNSINLDRNNHYDLVSIIKKLATKFQRTKSVEEMIQFLNSLIDTKVSWVEGQYTTIRYTIWAIPVFGFIGTIWGIGSSLQLVRESFSSKQLNTLVNTLSVAFDTTLIALILSILLVGLYHYIGNKEEQFYVNVKSYILENLINRIEIINEKNN